MPCVRVLATLGAVATENGATILQAHLGMGFAGEWPGRGSSPRTQCPPLVLEAGLSAGAAVRQRVNIRNAYMCFELPLKALLGKDSLVP